MNHAASDMRIVSLVPSLTELIIKMNLRQNLVGRTGFCIHPSEAVRDITKVGGTKQANIERIRALEPSHLVVNRDENDKPTVDALAEFIPNIVVTHPVAVDDNIALFRQFGDIFGRQVEAEDLVEAFKQARSRLLSRKFTPLRVIYLIWRNPWMTVASDTFISRMLAEVNLLTVPEQTDVRYPVLSDEDFGLAAPDVTLLSTEPYAFNAHHGKEVQMLAGMKNTDIRLIDGEMTSWYGSRAIDGLNYLGRFRDSLDCGA